MVINMELNVKVDSRKVKKGDTFIALRGISSDGHDYIESAIKNGASKLIVEEDKNYSVEYEIVSDTRAYLINYLKENYSKYLNEMKIIGITGTNGKTTSAYLLHNALNLLGIKTAYIGTIGFYINKKIESLNNTTPDVLDLFELLLKSYENGCKYVCMEVSSQGLSHKRVEGFLFDYVVFTNLTQDHLDYHKTMENYKAAKGMLFARAAKSVINMDDAAGAYMKEQSKGEVLTIGVDSKADLTAEGIDVSADGTAFDMLWQGKRYPVHLHTPGRFSVYNALGAAGACILLGVPVEEIVAGLTANPGVSGRFQTVRSKRGCQAVVDYAHTPDGLENVLNTANEFVKGKLIAVFGCGGDRDRTKRPIMGEIGGRLAGYCIITSDNPRTEDPEKILEDVEVGVKKTDCPYEKIVDRREAIQKAVAMAEAGDVILIAGKGHETYQIFPDKTIHFDDIEEVRKAFGEDCL